MTVNEFSAHCSRWRWCLSSCRTGLCRDEQFDRKLRTLSQTQSTRRRKLPTRRCGQGRRKPSAHPVTLL
jgi:hypothetical protein